MKAIASVIGILLVVVLVLAALNLFNNLTVARIQTNPPPVVIQDPPPPQQPPPTQPPQQPPAQPPPTQGPGGGGGTTAWTCPGQQVENGGCQVTTTTDVPANACVDYDPRGNDHPAGSYETIDTDQTRQRVRFTQPGQIVLAGGRATIYNNNYCPPYS